MPRSLTPFIVALLLLAPLAVRGDERPLRVLVSVLPLQLPVERVGGAAVRVDVLVGAGQNPHNYEPSPRQMAALADTDLFLGIGVPFEQAWLPRVTAANPQLRVLDGRAGMSLRRSEDDHGHDEGHGHRHAALDPHVWTDPQRVRVLVARLAAVLSDLRPAQAAAFAANAARLDADLAALDLRLQRRLACIEDRRFLVFHPAWGYFAERYGLEQVAIEFEGKEPGARALAAVIDAARAQGMRRVLVQPQFSRHSAAAVAAALQGEVVVADPLAPDLLQNLERVAELIGAGCTP